MIAGTLFNTIQGYLAEIRLTLLIGNTIIISTRKVFYLSNADFLNTSRKEMGSFFIVLARPPRD
jgi:hypothetical protein